MNRRARRPVGPHGRHGKERLTVRHGWLVGPVTLVAVLAAVDGTRGLNPVQWATGAVLGAAVTGLVVRARSRASHVLTPADLVTFARCMLACCVAAVALGAGTDGASDRASLQVAVAIAVVALLTDNLDGRLARRFGTSSFGGRFDGEADALLILVLALHVAADGRAWVLVLGLARYVFGAGELWVPWFRARLPFRYWRKVVAATQGVVLVAVAADVLPVLVEEAALLLALVLLLESFGRDVLWLRRHRELRAPVAAGVAAGVIAHATDPVVDPVVDPVALPAVAEHG